MSPDLVAALPVVLLVFGTVALAALHRIAPADERATVLVGALTAVAAGVALAAVPAGDAVGGAWAQDRTSVAVGALICVAAALAMLAEAPRALASPVPASAIVALALLSTAGAVVTASAADLLTLFVGLQLAWVPLAAATALERGGRGARGAVVLGVGGALVFGVGAVAIVAVLGTTRLGALAAADGRVARAGVALLFAAVAQSVTFAPFVLTRPGARAVAGGHHALALTVPALGGSAALIRMGSIVRADASAALDWTVTLAVVAAATIVFATLAAGAERSLRGLVAFAMTAQLGIAAAALAAGDAALGGAYAILASASVATIGASAAIAALGAEAPDALAGLARARPLAAASLALVLFSCAGVPPLAGFAARLAVYEAAARAQLAWLVIVASVASAAWTVIALRVVVASLRDGERPRPRIDAASGAALLVCAALVVTLGVAPDLLFGVVGR